MNGLRPLCVLIGALGGQGGGLLLEWLTGAARIAGYPAQGTSIPGVAQRTGATTYYFELFPRQRESDDVVFSLFPSSGDVDLVASLEPTEAGRAMQNGWITATTSVITTTGRIYSTAEKVAAGDGRIDPGPLLAALQGLAQGLYLIDPDATTLPLNARLLGAIAASGVLPLEPDTLRRSIRETGVAVEANLSGFGDGLTRGSASPPVERQPAFDPAPAGFEAELEGFPRPLRPLLGHALARLLDYQDRDYARLYLRRLEPLRPGADGETGLLQESARQLARWMCVEDVIRVAQLKTRPQRLRRIRRELGAGDDEPVVVHDYLSPRLAELTALLPGSVAAPRPGSGLALRWPTSSPLGYGVLKAVAGMRRLRRSGRGFRREQATIELWLAALAGCAGRDRELALTIARLAVWARGYGPVRERGLAELERLLSGWRQRLERNATGYRADLQASLQRALNDPDAIPCGGDQGEQQ